MKHFETYKYYYDVSDHSFYVAINSIMGLETLGLIRNFGFFKLPYSKKNDKVTISLNGYECYCDDIAIMRKKFKVKAFKDTTEPFEFVEG